MRILVLDDNKIIRSAPEDYFDDPHDYREDEFVQTKDVKEFVKLFFREQWDAVWFDHDLGGPKNGRHATKDIHHYILGCGRLVHGRPLCVIITMNPSAANNMISDLVAANLLVRYAPISALAPYGISRGDLL